MVVQTPPSAIEPFTTLVNDLDSVTTLKEITARCKDVHTLDEYIQFLATDEKVTKLWLLTWIRSHLARSQDIPERVIALAQKRLEAKNEKNYQRADSLRDQISKEGYSVKDTSDWFALTRNVESAPKGE